MKLPSETVPAPPGRDWSRWLGYAATAIYLMLAVGMLVWGAIQRFRIGRRPRMCVAGTAAIWSLWRRWKSGSPRFARDDDGARHCERSVPVQRFRFHLCLDKAGSILCLSFWKMAPPMALNFKDDETDRLAREVASLTGETLTVAVRRPGSRRRLARWAVLRRDG